MKVTGDLLPLFVPHGLGQKLLVDFELENVSYEEANWTYEYYFKEADNNQDLEGENKYELYKMEIPFSNTNQKNYSQFLINAAVAKSNIGSATSDIWALYAIIQMYQGILSLKNTGDVAYEQYIQSWFKKSAAAPKVIDSKMLNQICYVYTRLVEEYVINAIKHMEGGSSHFKMYYLANMTASENLKLVTEKLTKEFKLSPKAAYAMTDIIEWSKQNGIMKAVKAFISLYNKGTQINYKENPEFKNIFQYISKFTFFGGLVKDLYDLSDEYTRSLNENFYYFEGVKVGNTSNEDLDTDNSSMLNWFA